MAGRKHGDSDGEDAGLFEPARARDRPAEALDVRAVGHQLLDAARRLLAGRVGVEEGDDLIGVAAQQRELRRGEGGAECRHRLAEAVLMRHQAVEVALDEDGATLLAHGGAREIECVQNLSLDVERGLRGIEVLGFFPGEGAAAEGHDASLAIANREEQPPPETIVEAAAGLAREHETDLDQQIVADAVGAHAAPQRVPRGRSIAEPEAPGDLGIHPASVEILPRRGAAWLPECPAVELGGQGHRAAHRLELARRLGLGLARGGELHARALGERADGLGEGRVDRGA